MKTSKKILLGLFAVIFLGGALALAFSGVSASPVSACTISSGEDNFIRITPGAYINPESKKVIELKDGYVLIMDVRSGNTKINISCNAGQSEILYQGVSILDKSGNVQTLFIGVGREVNFVSPL